MGRPALRIRTAAEVVVMLAMVAVGVIRGVGGTPTWCIARSGVGATVLQTALDYTCGSRVADCAPVQPSGLCYLPNTLPSHASYAFNSYYQRSNGSPGACDFSGTATITVTDPSYGSCSYPSSASTAGGSTATPSTNTPSNTPGTIPEFGSTVPNIDTSTASPLPPVSLAACLSFISLLFWQICLGLSSSHYVSATILLENW